MFACSCDSKGSPGEFTYNWFRNNQSILIGKQTILQIYLLEISLIERHLLEFSYFSIFVCSLNLVRQEQQNIEVKRDRNIVLATAFLTIMFHVIISVNNNNIFQNLFIISFPKRLQWVITFMCMHLFLLPPVIGLIWKDFLKYYRMCINIILKRCLYL